MKLVIYANHANDMVMNLCNGLLALLLQAQHRLPLPKVVDSSIPDGWMLADLEDGSSAVLFRPYTLEEVEAATGDVRQLYAAK